MPKTSHSIPMYARRSLPTAEVVQANMSLVRGLQLVCLVVCSATALAQATPSTPTAVLPRFEKMACPEQIAREDKTECGMLTVPENRSNPKTRVIHLPVVIFRSHAADPARDAVLFMTGGP